MYPPCRRLGARATALDACDVTLLDGSTRSTVQGKETCHALEHLIFIDLIGRQPARRDQRTGS
jgi:hypothetical protein